MIKDQLSENFQGPWILPGYSSWIGVALTVELNLENIQQREKYAIVIYAKNYKNRNS